MLDLIITAFVSMLALITLVWFLYLKTQNTSIIDVFWSIAITVSALCYSGGIKFSHPSVLLIQCLLIIWAVRLSIYLFFTRILPKHNDSRYEQLAAGWKMKKNISFLLNFQFQGLLAMVIATPFLFITQHISQLNLYCLLIMAGIMLAIILESIADFQLFFFKKKNKFNDNEAVCNIGLWQYSRHPNYFFDWLSWLGFAMLAVQAPYGWVVLLSPGLLLFLMLGITIPITEQQSLQSRGEAFQHYQKTTRVFFPWLKKASCK